MKRKTKKKKKWAKDLNIHFIRRATNGQSTPEKMLNIISCQGSALSVKLNRLRIPSIGEECGTNGNCIHFWRNAE